MTVFGATGITAKYGQVTVLDQVDLPTLNDNEVLGLLGPNASGKSTLMRCLSGEKARSGTSRSMGGPVPTWAMTDGITGWQACRSRRRTRRRFCQPN